MLKGQAKRDYQREWVRQKRARVRQQGSTDVKTLLQARGLSIEGNKITLVNSSQQVQPIIPSYNPQFHRAGDTVMMQSPYSRKLIKVTIPALDADGNPIQGY